MRRSANMAISIWIVLALLPDDEARKLAWRDTCFGEDDLRRVQWRTGFIRGGL